MRKFVSPRGRVRSPTCVCTCFVCTVGWQTNPIILLTYTQGTTYDNKYAVPDYLNVLDAPSCSYSGESYTMADASSYQQALNKSVDVHASGSFGLLSASFSASADYQSMFSGGQSGSVAYVGTTAVSYAYYSKHACTLAATLLQVARIHYRYYEFHCPK